MIDRREASYAAFFALLPGIEGVEKTDRNSDASIEPDEMAALIQVDGGHQVMEDLHGQDEYALDVDVEIYVTAPTAPELAAAFNLLWGRLVQTVYENRTLGGLAQDTRHTGLSDPEQDRGEDGPPVMVATASFQIRMATAEGDPFTFP